MAYTVINFKTKKALKEAVKLDQNTQHLKLNRGIRCYNPCLGSDLSNHTGSVTLEGPHYPKPHTWYAQGEMINGILVSVK